MSYSVLITGGIHGNEPSGIEIVRYLEAHTLRDVSSLMGNARAIAQNKRYTETDLNRSFQVEVPVTYEERLAQMISKRLHAFSLIVDIHNTMAQDTTCAIVVTQPNVLHVMIAHLFGMHRIVIMPPSGSLIAQNPSHSISIEIAENHRYQFHLSRLVAIISRLSTIQKDSISPPTMEVYDYVRSIPRTTLKRLRISSKNLDNFVPLTQLQKKQLQLNEDQIYLPMFLKKGFPEEVGFNLIRKRVVI